MNNEISNTVREKAKQIKLVIFDVDGVLTDGSLFFGDDGSEYKAFNSLDGHGIKMLQQSGVDIAIITGRVSQVVKHRMRDLNVTHLYQGCSDKLPVYQELLEKVNLKASQVAYMGDDVIDLPVMTKVGFSAAVDNAHQFVKQHSDWTSSYIGGHGAARELCELIMDAQGNLDSVFEGYLK